MLCDRRDRPELWAFARILSDYSEGTEKAKNERLWLKTNMKLCKIWFDMGEYGRMNKELHKSCRKPDGSDDQKKGALEEMKHKRKKVKASENLDFPGGAKK
ncbi:hypothetical protein POM88_028167 [Heracleum sosnowskyi]|uniref:Uncharacterized protein n=1 Tax=Heracleum sosnowskyi TaxID=360622 RepID=A0AAD8MRN4_9APIA|nr:hypothetical protein POM88_028167 [Heracleum sosnowskyi]